MSHGAYLERSGDNWTCVICEESFGTSRQKAMSKIESHIDKHFVDLKESRAKSSRSSSGSGGGGFFDALGDILDAIAGN